MYWKYDVYKFALHQLPPFLRRRGIYALVKCIMIGLNQVYNSFIQHRKSVLLRLDHNGSSASLGRFLNDLFSLNNEIYVTEFVNTNIYLHMTGETAEEVCLGYLSEGVSLDLSSSSPNDITGGFIVNVPSVLASDENIATITKWVDYYKTAGKIYKIQIYE